METRKTPLVLTASALAMALVLVGCGGGSSGSPQANTTALSAPPATMPPPTTPPPPEPEPMMVDTSSVPGAKYLDEAPMLEDTTADIMIAAGEMANVGPYVLTNSHATESATVTVKDGEITATGGTVEATGFVEKYAKMIEANKKTMMAERTGRAMGLSDALTDAMGTRGQAILAAAKDDDLEIMRGMSDGAMVTDGQLGGTTSWTTATADSAISDFEGHKLTRKTEKIVVYTDIDAAKHKPFLTAYADDTKAEALVGAPVTVGSNKELQLNATAMVAAGNAGLLDPTKFPQPKDEGEGNNKYTYDNMEGAGKKSSKFKGTFHGAPGTYDCANEDCVVQVSDRSTNSAPEYHATETTGTWTFTPDTANNPQIVNQDADHMRFGWWVETPAMAATAGQYLYDAEIFYGGSQAFPTASNAVQLLDGNADYSGPAAGLFAVTGDDAAHGEFTATATLTAAFGNTTSPGAVSGKIADFMRDDGVANDWSVTLGSTNIAVNLGASNNEAGADDGKITGGSNDNIGAWEFRLYGPGTNGADPTGIAGMFRAAIDKNTAVAGAFATK